MLPSSGRSIGEKSTTVLPANRSIIVADSRFRGENAVDSPYNFNCDLSGTAIYAKEIYYQKLFWNQPLFAHNNSNNELRFQMNNDESITYVVYALPFVIQHQFDGNPPGTSLLPPQPFSYANDLEIALNNDVRSIPNNTTPFNGVGYISDPSAPLHRITIQFRYSPSKGFCIYPLQDSPTPGLFYTIRLMPCSFISNAHFVHGFGVYNPNASTLDYVPHDFFSLSVWSDTSPKLLPMRYIVIQSQELNKDRRLISFHNGNFANFVNELAIFAVNYARSGVYHEVGVGDDATVISLRDEYTPQSFRIQILDELGNVIHCDDVLTNLLNSQGVDPSFVYSFYTPGTYFGRGNPDFINYLVFGYRIMRTQYIASAVGTLNTAATPPGMANRVMTYQYIDFNNFNIAQNLDLSLTAPLNLSSSLLTYPGGLSQALGFFSGTALNPVFTPSLPQTFTMFTWYRDLNPFPYIRWDWQFNKSNNISTTGVSYRAYVYICLFDAVTFQVIMVASVKTLNTSNVVGSFGPFTNVGVFTPNWQINPDYVFPPSPSTITIGMSLAWVGLAPTPAYTANLSLMYAAVPPGAIFNVENPNRTDNSQDDEYVEPDIDYSYQFGDPLAGGLCEEVIHEIAAVLEYN